MEGDPADGSIQCVIGRAGGGETYLLFTRFEVQLGSSQPDEVEVYANDGTLLANGKDFVVSHAGVRSHDGWSGGFREIRIKTALVL